MTSRARSAGVLMLLVVVLLAMVGLAAMLSPLVGDAAAQASSVLIDSVYFDSYQTGDTDEAIALRNVGTTTADVGGWSLGDCGSVVAVLPAGTRIMPGRAIWITRDQSGFTRQFGAPADVVVERWPGFANSGDEVLLLDDRGRQVDVLVYGGGDAAAPGWVGAALQPYTVSSNFAAEGQILFRRPDPLTGLPVPDTNTAADWGQMRDDPIEGRKVRYPGWHTDEFFFPATLTATGVLTIAIAPDNAFDAVLAAINGADESIRLASLTAENVALGDALAAAARRGVDVTVLLEGGPPGGISNQGRFLCATLEAAGGACWFMFNDEDRDIFDRFRFMHAKYMIVDGATSMISTENLSPNSLPDDDKTDGTLGRRGVVLLSDSLPLARHLTRLFEADLDLAFSDLVRWQADDPIFGAPPSGFFPIRETGGVSYTVRYPRVAAFYGAVDMSIIQSPENSLRADDGLLGLLGRAGQGDLILVQQLSERPHWGPTTSNAVADPNPRIEGLLAAARRGATVRLMLDGYFDDAAASVSNQVTCDYVNRIARTERLAAVCITANPTGLGIHNKMMLLHIGGRGYVHLGSLNGTELSHKGNRELVLLLQSDSAFAYLRDVFERDWPRTFYFPVVMHAARGPANHVLISEIDYNPPGPDDAEYIELVNPTTFAFDLSAYRIGDATTPEDYEDMRHFPPGTIIAPGQALVIATAATAFRLAHGFPPDFEVLSTDPAVPDLIDDTAWGDISTFLQLGNQGDEVYLRGDGGVIVDMIAYGNSPHAAACPLLVPPDRVLERYPYWLDTDNCPADFRPWAFPNPGRLP